MSYRQTAYSQKVGNGNYTIAQIGCLLTAICNDLQEEYGVTVDPPTLNAWYEQHGLYLNDPGDGPGVKDDLSWNSLTQYHPQATIVKIGGAGWPNSNNAIVKFFYKSTRTGVWETHFCKVADHNAHTIVDSWDGVVKAPGEYGEPVGFAVYGNANVQPVVTASNPSVAAQPHPSSPPPNGPSELFLPSAAGTWRVYKVGGPYSSAPVDHSIHKLIPGAFPPGLTYQVLDTLAPHVFKIQTQDYGQVAIYAGPDTIAQFPGGGHGEGEDQSANSTSTYTGFATAMNLYTNKPTVVYNYRTGGTQPEQIPKGSVYVAIGKVVTSDGQTYFVTQTDQPLGVKTVDLSPAGQSVTDNSNPSPTGDKVQVKVGNWQDSYTAFMSPQRYVANKTLPIEDINEDPAPLPDQRLLKGQVIRIAGKFIRDGIPYYRSAGSVANNTWYGVPLTSVTKAGSDEELAQVSASLENDELTKTPIKKSGGLSRFFGKNK